MNWIKFEEQCPAVSGKYLTFDSNVDYYAVLNYSAKHQVFNAYDYQKEYDLYPMKVTHWCELDLPMN